jgi:Tfp pilus assembly protein PilF
MSTAAARLEKSDPPPTSALGAFASPEKRTLVLSLLLMLLTLALYNPLTHSAFINYDDNRYVTENSHVRAGLAWSTVKWAFTSFDQANWHPLTWISHALDCQLFGLNPAGHHLSSVALHAINVVLLFLLLIWSTRRTGPSFLAAALFALHPFNVESVAWIAERKNLLSTTFFLLTLRAYGRYAQKPGWQRYLAVAGLLACGLASKPMLVTTPFVLLLIDSWPLGRIKGWSDPSQSLAIQQVPLGRLVLEKLPLLLLSVASSAITVVAQRAAGAVQSAPFPLSSRLENGIYSYAMYLRKAVWPTDFALFYPYAGHSLAAWKVGAAALLIAAITIAVVKMRSRGYLPAGWFWFLGTLVPVIGVIQVGNQAMADRYAYLPLIGIFVIVAWAGADLAEKKKLVPMAMAAAICALLVLAVITYRQIGYWRSSVDVWTHSLAITQHNYVAEENLGVALVQLNRANEAYPLFVRAAEDQPNDPDARLNIGTYLYQHGRQAEAIEQYELAIRLASEPGLLAATYANLGLAYSDLGNSAQAESSFRSALQFNPDQITACQGMANLLANRGKLAEALPYFKRAAELQPSGQGYLQLAKVLAQTGHKAEARAALETALRLEPGLVLQ